VLFGGLPGPLLSEPYPALTVSPERTHDDMLAAVAAFTATTDTTGIHLQVHARDGGAVTTILDEAKTLPADLIVLGTHGHSGFQRWVLGSVTEKILRRAACPVLTVPPPVTEPVGDAVTMLKRILCPFDFSDSSLKALEYALSLAKEADAELLLMHVIEGLTDVQHWQQPTNPSLVEFLRLTEQNALARLREVLPRDAATWCRPKELLMTGKPYEEILRVARDEEVHLIVMGVYSRNPIDLLFVGSTTNQVVRASSCPVLTLKG
jgi:nucleotide-binding universal stress UspA family protein